MTILKGYKAKMSGEGRESERERERVRVEHLAI
jgi:hypothetical protein